MIRYLASSLISISPAAFLTGLFSGKEYSEKSAFGVQAGKTQTLIRLIPSELVNLLDHAYSAYIYLIKHLEG